VLGYTPRVTLEEGLVELAEWLKGQEAQDNVDAATGELRKRGLTV
jgi:dTDP-L-rhamnose 4-epimerase